MINKLFSYIWVKFGIKLDESYGHHVCMKCQKVLFCFQTGIDLDGSDRCKFAEDGGHEEWEVSCNCDTKDMKFIQKIKVKLNFHSKEEKW